MTARAATRHVVTVSIGSIAAGLLALGLLAAGTRWWMPPEVSGPVAEGGWTARSRAWFTSSGFFPPEYDRQDRRRFSWTGSSVRLFIPQLERSQVHHLTLRVGAWRPPGAPPPPLVRLSVDGVVRVTTASSNERVPIVVDLPRRNAPGAVVGLDLSNTFVPGPQDTRALGVVIDEVSLSPATGHFRPSGRVAAQTALAVMTCVAGVLLCGLPVWLAVAMSAAVAAAFPWLLLQDAAFIGTYADRLVHIGIGVSIAGCSIGLARWRWRDVRGVPELSTGAALVLGAIALQLALFAHPLAIVGDAIFQVHRASEVHGGRYFFTSITPQPFFEFPYPVALYVVALPFWRFFPTELDLVRLLRGLTLCANALVAVAIYAAARRQWNDRRTALLCAALWPFASAPLQSLSNANLTNAFGQALFGAAMGVLAWTAAGARRSLVALVAAGALLTAAFLSHFSTISVGVPILFAVGALLTIAGGTQGRRAGTWVLVVVLAAAGVSYGIYYSHFNGVYRATAARMIEQAGAPPAKSKVVAPPAIKFQRWVAGTSDDYGLPGAAALTAAAAGMFLLLKRRPREPFTLVLAAWAGVWAAFTAIELLSPVEMRLNLAAAPMFVCLAAYALGALATRSRVRTALALAAAVVIAWDGVRICLICIGLNPRW